MFLNGTFWFLLQCKMNPRDSNAITRKMIAYASQLHHYHLNKDVQMYKMLTAVAFCNN